VTNDNYLLKQKKHLRENMGGRKTIEDGGTLQEGIPYTYQEDKANYPPKYKTLRFTFGGRVEILECK
jgi:hypothetical protein